jgi:hypothetical protein
MINIWGHKYACPDLNSIQYIPGSKHSMVAYRYVQFLYVNLKID